MRKFLTVSALFLVLISPLAFAQFDNCETISQRGGINSIPMQAGGLNAVAVLNTGILPIGISRTLAESLGSEVQSVPSRNRVWSAIPAITGQVSDVPVRLFNQDLELEQMYVMDTPGEFAYLSLLMFDDFVIQMNLPQSQLCFLNRGAVNLKDTANLRMRMVQGRIAIQVAINQQDPVWVELQLEYPGALRLNRDVAIALGLTREDDTATSGNIETLMFGPYELGNIAVAFPAAVPLTDNQAALQRLGRRNGGLQTSGALGYEVLKHFVTTFDVQTERLNVYVP